MGDAAGIGAEIIIKALGDESLRKVCQPIIIGDISFLRRTARDLDSNIDFFEFEADSSLTIPLKYVSSA